jgi:hypothetical protein
VSEKTFIKFVGEIDPIQIMTVYQRSTEKVDTMIARERAPAAAHQDMFHGDQDLSQRGNFLTGVTYEMT